METEQEDEIGLSDDMVCSFCYAEFVDSEDLQVHVQQVHLTEASKTRFCKICTKFFVDIESYALHVRNEHLSKLKCCKYCIRLFLETEDLLKHQKRHNASALRPKISCAHCNSYYYNKRELEKHDFKEHIDVEEGLILKDCLSILSSLLNMNVRRFLEASYGGFQYTCIVCDTSTLDVSIYINHLINKKCRSLSCELCCNVFTSKRNLYVHIMRHIFPQYNYKNPAVLKKQCVKCQQMFKSNSLKLHMKKCAGLRCVPCNIVFDCVNNYTDHMSRHTKQMIPLEVCIYCQRQMVGVDAMMKHVSRTHKHEIHLYKYHCTDCDRLFKHPKLLFAHFFSKHKDLHPYTCKICDKTFRIRKNFSLHIKLDHKSIGFVEFDENFHVSFTDSKSVKQSNCQAVMEDAVNGESDKNELNIENNVSLTLSEEDSNSSNKETIPIEKDQSEVETINNKNDVSNQPDDPLQEELYKTDIDRKLEESEDKHLKGDKFAFDKVVVEVAIDVDNESNYEIEKTHQRRRKRNIDLPYKQLRKKIKIQETDTSSDDSDTPLLTIHKRLSKNKRKHKKRDRNTKIRRTTYNKNVRNPKKSSKNFICTKCNRNCYTFQNFNRHQALHLKNENKVCIKCNGKFDSVTALNEHIKAKHSSSKLTETLKKLIEKRKTTEANEEKCKYITEKASNENTEEPRELSISEKFRNTIKKVPIEKSNTKATLSVVNNSKISVKKYLENFVPETNDVKLSIVPQKCPLETGGVSRRPIRLTRFTPEPNNLEPMKLRMPVRFTDNIQDKYEVSIQLVQNITPPSMNFVNEIEDPKFEEEISYDDTYEAEDHYQDTETQNKSEVIPEVAQEVLLVGTEEEPCKVLHTMSLKNIRPGDDIAVAHLLPHAPFYKISKLKSVLGKDGQTFIPKDVKVEKQVIEEMPKDITLPNGTKLVNVNPLAHLMDKDTICEVLKARKPKYLYYRPKLRNITEAITKAMVKLEKLPTVKKKV